MTLGMPVHPLVVHVPVALLVLSPLFELVGRTLDAAWWRNAALTLLLIGVMGAAAAVVTGSRAGATAERHGVPEQAVDAHERMAYATLWLGLAAAVAYGIAARVRRARAVVSALALLLQLAAAVTVGIAGHRGGVLVYQHGAAVEGYRQPAPAPPAEAARPDRD